MAKFKDKYGEIPNVSENKFFTNSIHVPVWKEVNPFQKIDIEAELTGYSSAGCITYVEFDSTAKNNLEALEKVVDYAMSKDIPYFAINVPNDQCADCGYQDEIPDDECPMCGGYNIRRLRRVTGLSSGNALQLSQTYENKALSGGIPSGNGSKKIPDKVSRKELKNSNLEFRKIPSLKFLYEVNENGTIFRNVKSKKQLKIKLDYHHSKKGYYVTFVHLGGRKNPQIIRVMIAHAVAECWLGEKPEGYEVDHIDRNSHNNDWRNLRYVTKSGQMKNRDHSNISKTGAENLERARQLRMKPVLLSNNDECLYFKSYADCARYLQSKYGKSFDSYRDRLKRHRSKILDYDVKYLNAETGRDGFTEQGTVQLNN